MTYDTLMMRTGLWVPAKLPTPSGFDVHCLEATEIACESRDSKIAD